MTTGKELATTQGSGSLALRGDQVDWTPAQRAALAQIGIDKAPAGDQQVFLHVAQRVGLDPFARQIYLIGRKDDEAPGGKKWTIQTGIDGFRVFSERHPQYAGDLGAEWCGEDGVWHDVWTAKEPPVAARFTVLRKDRPHPVTAVAHYSEYVQTKYNGDPTKMWLTKPAGQIAKCAEALCRRRAFPQDLGSVYVDDEMEHADNPPRVIIQSEREQPAEPDWDALIREGETAQDLTKLADAWKLARGMRPNDAALLDRIAQAGERVKAAAAQQQEPPPEPDAPAAEQQPAEKRDKNRLFALLREGSVTSTDRTVRLRIVSRILNRVPELTSFDELTTAEAATVNEFMQRHKDIGDLAHTLAELGAASPAEQPPDDDTPPDEPGQQPAADTEGDRGDT